MTTAKYIDKISSLVIYIHIERLSPAARADQRHMFGISDKKEEEKKKRIIKIYHILIK